MLKGQHLGVGLQRRVKILQKQLFLRGAGVERQVQRLNRRTAQDAPGGQFFHHAFQRVVAAGAVGTAQKHHAAGAGGILRRAQHKGAAERLDQRRDKGILPQHLGFDFIRHTGKICLAVGSRGRGGRGHRAAQQAILFQRLCQLTAHLAHILGGGGTGFLHRAQRTAGGGLAFLGRAQGFQLGLHLLHGIAGSFGLLLIGGVFAAAHQAADPGIVLIFQAHFPSSISGSILTSAPAFFLGIFTV